jgi:hypothetical protein
MTKSLPDSVRSLTDTMLVQADSDNCELAIDCSDRDGGGIVLTGSKSLSVARWLLDAKGYSRPILLDRGFYAGSKRRFAANEFDSNWISRQRELSLGAVLPDAGYIAEGDESGLASILDRTTQLGERAIAPLGLHLSWLNAKKGLNTLIEKVTETGIPVAIALEHAKDPLSVGYAHQGLLTLLDTGVPVILLRCDVSAIGALCFGATAAAVGTTKEFASF